MVNITRQCPKCAGTGIYMRVSEGFEIPVDPCPQCDGSGQIDMFQINLSDIDDKLDDINDKLDDIMEQLTE